MRCMPVYVTSHRTFSNASIMKGAGSLFSSCESPAAAAHPCSQACSVFIVLIVRVVIVFVIKILDDA